VLLATTVAGYVLTRRRQMSAQYGVLKK
jgi:hypothetical protein